MNYDNYVDAPVFDQNGDKIGNISHLYYTVDEHVPEWATVRSGLFGMSKHFVPLWDSHETEDGVVIKMSSKKWSKTPHPSRTRMRQAMRMTCGGLFGAQGGRDVNIADG